MNKHQRANELLLESGPTSGLTSAQWEAILKQLPPPAVDNNTSAHHAGFLLGIQYALGKVQQFVRFDR